MSENELLARCKELGPWYHNTPLPHGRSTCPIPGRFNPQLKWNRLAKILPANMSGLTTLEVAASSAYYSTQMARRGARAFAFDQYEHAVRQANFVAEQWGVRIDARQGSVYDLAPYRKTSFSFVLFLGILYHCRYPLLALDCLSRLHCHTLILQTMTTNHHSRGFPELIDHNDPAFDKPNFPGCQFIEGTLRGDWSNWWKPNASAVEAMLRAAGFDEIQRIGPEWWTARGTDRQPNEQYQQLARAELSRLPPIGQRPA